MFPAVHLGAPGLCDANHPRLVPPDFTKTMSPPNIRHHPQPAHTHGQDVRASMTSMSFSAIASAGIKPFPGLPLGSIPGTSTIPASAVSLPSSLIHPAAMYPAVSLGAGPSPTDFRNISLYHSAVNQVQLSGEMGKMKAPVINRNYLELAMLVCNTFRGKLFPCPHCRYVTDRRNNLKRHISTMHQACDKVLECCGVQFSTKASLREHIMIFHHNGYSCPYCGRRFCRKALLKRHLSVHSGQKDYSCPNCDYATSHKSNLERHKRIHDRLKFVDEHTRINCEDFNHAENQLPDTTVGHAQCVVLDHNVTPLKDLENLSDSEEELEVVSNSDIEHSDNELSEHHISQIQSIEHGQSP